MIEYDSCGMVHETFALGQYKRDNGVLHLSAVHKRHSLSSDDCTGKDMQLLKCTGKLKGVCETLMHDQACMCT